MRCNIKKHIDFAVGAGLSLEIVNREQDNAKTCVVVTIDINRAKIIHNEL